MFRFKTCIQLMLFLKELMYPFKKVHINSFSQKRGETAELIIYSAEANEILKAKLAHFIYIKLAHFILTLSFQSRTALFLFCRKRSS